MGIFNFGPFDLNTCSLVGRIITATAANQAIIELKNTAGITIMQFGNLADSGALGVFDSTGTQTSSNGFTNFYTKPMVIGGTTVGGASILRLDSTTRGLLVPRMTTAEKGAIGSPVAGLVVYDTTLGKLCIRGAAAWETITSV